MSPLQHHKGMRQHIARVRMITEGLQAAIKAHAGLHLDRTQDPGGRFGPPNGARLDGTDARLVQRK